MDAVDDVKQTETYLTTLRARKMANNNSDSGENDSSTEEASWIYNRALYIFVVR